MLWTSQRRAAARLENMPRLPQAQAASLVEDSLLAGVALLVLFAFARSRRAMRWFGAMPPTNQARVKSAARTAIASKITDVDGINIFVPSFRGLIRLHQERRYEGANGTFKPVERQQLWTRKAGNWALYTARKCRSKLASSLQADSGAPPPALRRATEASSRHGVATPDAWRACGTPAYGWSCLLPCGQNRAERS